MLEDEGDELRLIVDHRLLDAGPGHEQPPGQGHRTGAQVQSGPSPLPREASKAVSTERILRR